MQQCVCIDIEPCARSYPGFPKSVDENQMDELRTIAVKAREWLESINQPDRRIQITRWEAKDDGTDRTAWRMQWNGESGDLSPFARDEYFKAVKHGELHTVAPVVAALVGCKEEALDSLYQIRIKLPEKTPEELVDLFQLPV